MISVRLRHAISAVLVTLAAAIWFAPGIEESAQALIGLGFVLIGAISHPSNEHVGNPPPILWRDRDAGQQFSIVMFHVMILAAVAFCSYQLALNIDGLLGNAAAAALLCAGIWMAVRNWKNRNAR